MKDLHIEEGSYFGKDNRYQLIKEKGRGSFASVWLAHDTVVDTNVALKIYAPDFGMDTQGIEDFKEEFRLSFNLQHSNILHLSHYEIWENRPYIILPFYSLGSASSLVGKADEEKTWQFIEEVAAGLEYLHGQTPRIIHQDIKPGNILIDNNGHFIITDFGISLSMHKTLQRTMSAATENERKKVFSGTIPYMGPERFGECPRIAMASDIWSLGASAYELLEGDVPFGDFGGQSQSSISPGLPGRIGKVPPIMSEVSSELKNLIYACLAENTWDRPTASKIVETCRERKRKSGAEPLPPPQPQPQPKHRYVWLLAVACMIVLLALGWMIFPGGNTPTAPDASQRMLVATADSLVNQAQLTTKNSGQAIVGVSLQLLLSQACERYEQAASQSLSDGQLSATANARATRLHTVLDSLESLGHLTDTIGELLNEGRVMTADNFKERQTRLSDEIKKMINEL